MTGALRIKSSEKDDLFVNSDLIRLIFFQSDWDLKSSKWDDLS